MAGTQAGGIGIGSALGGQAGLGGLDLSFLQNPDIQANLQRFIQQQPQQQQPQQQPGYLPQQQQTRQGMPRPPNFGGLTGGAPQAGRGTYNQQAGMLAGLGGGQHPGLGTPTPVPPTPSFGI